VAAAFAAGNAFQCGFCSPGFVMAVHGLLAADGAPDETTVRAALTGNLCRCGSYPLILEAVRGLAAEDRAGR
jgi:carbon-monoxide dehydrogenase small subunit